MPGTLLIAQALSLEPTLSERAQFAFVGLAVVVLSLAALALFCGLAGVVFRTVEASATPPAAAPAPATPAGMSLQEVAVIAAAVSEALDKPHRIVHIRGLTPEDLKWSSEGRMMHHTSHSPRRGGS